MHVAKSSIAPKDYMCPMYSLLCLALAMMVVSCSGQDSETQSSTNRRNGANHESGVQASGMQEYDMDLLANKVKLADLIVVGKLSALTTTNWANGPVEITSVLHGKLPEHRCLVAGYFETDYTTKTNSVDTEYILFFEKPLGEQNEKSEFRRLIGRHKDIDGAVIARSDVIKQVKRLIANLKGGTRP